jgi:hypothetical protein
MPASKKVRRVQELRRSNAAGAVPSKKVYSRKSSFFDQMSALRSDEDAIGTAEPGTTASGNKA